MEQRHRAAVISGWIISTLIILFMLVDGIGHVMKFAPYVKGTLAVEYAESVIMPLGIVELVITLLYAIPRTRILGAILLTAHFGLYLRDARLRTSIPLTNP